MKMPWLPTIVASGTVVAILAGTWLFDQADRDRRLYDRRSRISAELTALETQIQSNLKVRAMLGYSLATYIATEGRLNTAAFNTFAGSIIADDPAIQAVQVVQGPRVLYRYPPLSPTEINPRVPTSAACPPQPIAAGRSWAPSWTLATDLPWDLNPVCLPRLQFDRPRPLLLINTTMPIRQLAPSSQPPIQVQVAIKVNQVVEDLRANRQSSVHLAVWVRGQALERQFGESILARQQPVRSFLQVGNSHWELAALPRDGWVLYSRRSLWTWLTGCGLAIIGGIQIYRWMQLPARLADRAQSNEDRWQLVLQGNNDGIWDWNPKSDEVVYSSRWKSMLGYQADQIGNRRSEWISRVHPDDLGRVLRGFDDYVNRKIDEYSMEYRLRCRDGQYKWISARGQAQWDRRGQVQRMVGSITDIDKRKRSEAALRESEERFRAIVEQAAIGICQIDPNGRYLHVNQRFCNLLGYTEAELLQQTFQDLTYPGDLAENLQQSQRLWRGDISSFSLEKRYMRKDGQLQWVNVTVSLVQSASDAQPYTLALVEDISARKQAEEQLTYNAFYDALTGLPNRNLFVDRLKVCLSQSQRHANRMFGVLYVDLDRFKVVNDSLGHHAGDELLVQIGRRLQSCLRCNDTVARLGGDEFAVILDDVGTSEEALWVADRVQEHLKQPFHIHGHDFYTSASIGVALSQDPATQQPYANWQNLMRDADIAMYRAKANGKGCSQVFEPMLHHSTLTQLQIESDLRQALSNNGLEVYFQPIVRIQDRRLVGFEALVRWNHPQQGWISPSVMVAAAEETDLIVHLGEWVLAAACAQLQQWRSHWHRDHSHLPLSISVNIAGRQFAQANLVQQIERTLMETGLPPACLRIEVTESVIAERVDSVVDKLARLKALGVQSCIDDFGTGYSSLSRLQQFPINALKVDRSFVKDLPYSEDSAAIVRTIVNLARSLNIHTVAEGIETPEQLQCLEQLGCDYGQGFLFAKPMQAAAAEELLRGDRVLSVIRPQLGLN
ncbi:MAG: EAL domain-containing protein [Limnothrix sp.]|nr:EAL domain-containing protein [Limnothrix sp.]